MNIEQTAGELKAAFRARLNELTAQPYSPQGDRVETAIVAVVNALFHLEDVVTEQAADAKTAN